MVKNSKEEEPGKIVDFIAKPKRKFSFEKCKADDVGSMAGVGTLPQELPHYKISEAGDFVRLHPDDRDPDEGGYWSSGLSFVNVPIKGSNRENLHIIDKQLALLYVDSGKIKRFRLALATKPDDVFFLCHVPSVNLDNTWNRESLKACEQAKTRWVEAISRKSENKEGYLIKVAQEADAFHEPRWPALTFEEIVGATFGEDRFIDREDHPALDRLLGRRPKLA
jgi:hypothetical protein